jgi:hypothetical protein
VTAEGRQRARRKEAEVGVALPLFLIRGEDQDIETLKKGECHEREKQRGKGKQEGAAEKPEREEKDEEGEEEQVDQQRP